MEKSASISFITKCEKVQSSEVNDSIIAKQLRELCNLYEGFVSHDEISHYTERAVIYELSHELAAVPDCENSSFEQFCQYH